MENPLNSKNGSLNYKLKLENVQLQLVDAHEAFMYSFSFIDSQFITEPEN